MRSVPNTDVQSSNGRFGCEKRGAALIALRDDLEQQFRARLRERHVAQFVDAIWRRLCPLHHRDTKNVRRDRIQCLRYGYFCER